MPIYEKVGRFNLEFIGEGQVFFEGGVHQRKGKQILVKFIVQSSVT